MRMWLYKFLKYRVLPWLDPVKCDDVWGFPIPHSYSLTTRQLTSAEHFEMLNWIEQNVHGKIAMGMQPYWQPKQHVLGAHRDLADRNNHLDSIGSAPFCFSRKGEFEAFKAAWG